MTLIKIQTPRKFVPLLNPARYKGAHGGRGSAKSHFFAEMTVEDHVIKKTHTVCIREVQKSLDQSVKKLIEMKIESMGVQDHFKILRTHIEDRHGGRIIFQGMQNHTADSIKSLEGYDVAWVEEAQSLSQRSLDLLRPTIRKPGSELRFSWNPDDKKDPVDALLRGSDRPPNSIVVEANWRDNPWFPDVLRDEMLYDRRRDIEKYNHIWEGGYNTKSKSRVFTNWRIDTFDTPSDVDLYFGADWGFSIDPTVLISMFIVGRTIYIFDEAYAVGCEIDKTPFLFAGASDEKIIRLNQEAYKALNAVERQWRGIVNATKHTITADSARPETISYMKKHGFPLINPSIKGSGSVEDGIEFMKSYDIVVHERCTHTIDELSHYSYKINEKTQEITNVLSEKKNHVIDACRYALEKLRRSGYSLHDLKRAVG